jgi:hypothetical protein
MRYTLTRSRRKTAAIYVRYGEVEVRAPLRMPKREIDRFVLEKEGWILKSLTKQRVQTERKESFVVDYGNSVLFRGKLYPITQRAGTRAGFGDVYSGETSFGATGYAPASGHPASFAKQNEKETFFMPPGLSPEQIKSTCVRLYKILARAHISKRVDFFAPLMGVTTTTVKINNAMKRWGSCSTQKNLNFSWRLIMADDAIIDYVFVHELAHIKEMNHSSRFWTIVEGVLPDFRECKRKLKELQNRLSGEDWG